MKKILFVALCASMSYFAQSQTKGTNAIGFGFGLNSSEAEFGEETQKQKTNSYSLSYGNFIKENVKLSILASYGHSESEYLNSTNSPYSSDGYGAGIAYQKYFPVIQKFFVYASGNTSYSRMKQKSGTSSMETNQYMLGASGGVAYFLNKRIALEATLLNAHGIYASSKNTLSNDKSKSTSLGLSSSGALNNLSFQIYFLF